MAGTAAVRSAMVSRPRASGAGCGRRRPGRRTDSRSAGTPRRRRATPCRIRCTGRRRELSAKLCTRLASIAGGKRCRSRTRPQQRDERCGARPAEQVDHVLELQRPRPRPPARRSSPGSAGTSVKYAGEGGTSAGPVHVQQLGLGHRCAQRRRRDHGLQARSGSCPWRSGRPAAGGPGRSAGRSRRRCDDHGRIPRAPSSRRRRRPRSRRAAGHPPPARMCGPRSFAAAARAGRCGRRR